MSLPAKWVIAVRRSGPAAFGGGPVHYVADATDALLAAVHGREARPCPIAALACDRSESGPEPEAGVDVFRVDEIVHWDDPGDVDPTAAVALFYFVRRKPGTNLGVFEEHYRQVHAPLARIHHPGVQRYVQNFVRSSSANAAEIDAIAELHFRTEQDVRERFHLDAGSPRVIAADVERFLDLRRGFVVVARPEPRHLH